MSGYNGYPIILSGNNRTYQDKASYVNVVGDDKNVINLTRISFNTAAIFSYVKQNGELTSYNKYIESFKIKVTGIDYSRFVIKYSYISEANATAKTTMTIASDGIYELPKSFASDGSLTSSDIWIGIIENSPEGKALLDNQLKLVKNLKTSIIEMSQREMQLFNAFKEASAKNPSLTYEEFIKTMK